MANINLEIGATRGGTTWLQAMIIVDGKLIQGELVAARSPEEVRPEHRESVLTRVAVLGGELSDYVLVYDATFDSEGFGVPFAADVLIVRRESISAMAAGELETRDMPDFSELTGRD